MEWWGADGIKSDCDDKSPMALSKVQWSNATKRSKRACTGSVTGRKVTNHPLAYEACRLHFDLRWLLSAGIS